MSALYQIDVIIVHLMDPVNRFLLAYRPRHQNSERQGTMKSSLLTAMMIDDCLHDPVLGAKVLLGYDSPPHMELRLWGMWNNFMMIDSSGLGTGKTLCIAIVSALRSMLLEDRVSGIISRAGAQARLITDIFDKWAKTKKIMVSQMIQNITDRPRITHKDEVNQIFWKNGSVIRIQSPGFTQDANRLASEDWNDGYCDEWTRYQDFDAFWRIVVGRMRRPVNPIYDGRDPIFGNHLYLSGTATYQWAPAYKQWERVYKKMMAGERGYEAQSWNYTQIPKKFEALSRETKKFIGEQMANMTRVAVRQEVFGEWVKDSASCYRQEDIEAVRNAACPIMIKGEE